MKLYVDSTKPEVGVWCVGRVIKVNVGLYPLGIVAELAMWLCCSVMFMGLRQGAWHPGCTVRLRQQRLCIQDPVHRKLQDFRS